MKQSMVEYIYTNSSTSYSELLQNQRLAFSPNNSGFYISTKRSITTDDQYIINYQRMVIERKPKYC